MNNCETLQEAMTFLVGSFIAPLSDEEFHDDFQLMVAIEKAYYQLIDSKAPVVSKLSLDSFSNYPLPQFTEDFFRLCGLPELTSRADDARSIYYRYSRDLAKIPVRGCLVLNSSLTKLLMVNQNSIPGFPRGKRDQDETDVETAIREVYEETGIDIKQYISSHEYVESAERKNIRLYVVITPYSGHEQFKPHGREITSIYWQSLTEIPIHNHIRIFTALLFQWAKAHIIHRNVNRHDNDQIRITSKDTYHTLVERFAPVCAGLLSIIHTEPVTGNYTVSYGPGNKHKATPKSPLQPPIPRHISPSRQHNYHHHHHNNNNNTNTNTKHGHHKRGYSSPSPTRSNGEFLQYTPIDHSPTPYDRHHHNESFMYNLSNSNTIPKQKQQQQPQQPSSSSSSIPQQHGQELDINLLFGDDDDDNNNIALPSMIASSSSSSVRSRTRARSTHSPSPTPIVTPVILSNSSTTTTTTTSDGSIEISVSSLFANDDTPTAPIITTTTTTNNPTIPPATTIPSPTSTAIAQPPSTTLNRPPPAPVGPALRLAKLRQIATSQAKV